MSKGVLIATVYIALFVTSIFYNKLVAWMEREGLLNGYMAILATGGCGYTIVALAFLLPPETTLLIAGAFIVALLPMILGDIGRDFKARIGWREFWSRVTRKNKNDEDR
jgi:hypothetical protein